jgi:hypothetical protein
MPAALHAPFGLDMFQWWAVVAVFILSAAMQAILVGRRLELSWSYAFVLSFLLNGVWAGLLFCFSPIRFAGSATPNPTGFAATQLTHLAIVTTFALGLLWYLAAGRKTPFMKVMGLTGLAQLLWIPLSLLVLMSPSEPFEPLETRVAMVRYRRIVSATHLINAKLPEFASPEEFASAFNIAPETILYPHFPRWATCDEGNVALEVNTDLSGYEITTRPNHTWLWRYPIVTAEGKIKMRERRLDRVLASKPTPDSRWLKNVGR